MSERVAYEPVSVKDVLAEMKDTAEALVDLAFSAVLHDSDDVAREVLALEEHMDVLQLRARMSLLLAARTTEDAERLAPVLGVVGAAEKTSDAAGDVAKIVLEDIGLPDAMRAALPEAVEAVARADLGSESSLAGRTLGASNLETRTGVRVVAVRRDSEWDLDPNAETDLRPGDTLVLRGPEAGIRDVYEDATGGTYGAPETAEAPVEDLERAVDSVVLMKNISELAVDLAYGSVLYDSEALAEEVVELEVEVDALQARFEAWVLRAAARVEDPVSLRGLFHLASSTEVISDAALEISEGVLRGLDAHDVVQEAVEESDEVIVRFTVAEGAELDGTTLGDAAVGTETGMAVVAVRRPGDETEWVVQPGPETDLQAGDVLLATGTRAAAERLAELAGDAVEFAS